MSTVGPPKMRKTFSTAGTSGASVTHVLLGLVLLRSDAAVVLLEHVALLVGVVDGGLVIRAKLLQHVVEHAGASRALAGGSTARASSSSSSRAAARASRWGFLPF
jgi:hypothetical protein